MSFTDLGFGKDPTYVADFSSEYAALIRDRILKRDGTPLPNGTIAHAMMLLHAMFGNAKKSVRILTGTLNARVYGTEPLINAAKQFLANPEHTLEIIFEERIDDLDLQRHPLLSALDGRTNVKLWRLRPNFQGTLKSHFALMDDDSYRFEADKTKDSAVVAFGDKAYFRTLDEYFETIKKYVSDQARVPVNA